MVKGAVTPPIAVDVGDKAGADVAAVWRDFQDFTDDALGNGTEFAFKHWRELGVVSDVAWVRKAVWRFMRGNVRVFHDYEMEQAKTWIASHFPT